MQQKIISLQLLFIPVKTYSDNFIKQIRYGSAQKGEISCRNFTAKNCAFGLLKSLPNLQSMC